MLEEGAGLGLAEDVVAHGRIETGEGAELIDPVRVREEAAVEDDVDVERQSVLVAEGDDVDPEVSRIAGAEQVAHAVAEPMHVQVARVDDDVGVGLQRFDRARSRSMAWARVPPSTAKGWRRRVSS